VRDMLGADVPAFNEEARKLGVEAIVLKSP
jgi:hypothetical protein